MGYHPFELIRLVSAHTRTTAEVFSGERPELILAFKALCHTPHLPSVSIHSTSLSLAFALQGFFPQQIVILSQPSGWPPRSRCLLLLKLLLLSVPNHLTIWLGNLTTMYKKLFNFFPFFSLFTQKNTRKKCLPRGCTRSVKYNG